MAVLEEDYSSVPPSQGRLSLGFWRRLSKCEARPSPQASAGWLSTPLGCKSLSLPPPWGTGGHSGAVPSLGISASHPTPHPALLPISRRGTGEYLGRWLPPKTHMGFERSELNLSIPLFRNSARSLQHLGGPASPALGKDSRPGSVMPGPRLVWHCRSMNESRAVLGTCGRGVP